MIIKAVESKEDLRTFYRFPRVVYKGNINHRATEESLVHLLISGPTAFHTHARVRPYLIIEGQSVTGRFALIHDTNLPEYVQTAFFEALPGQNGIDFLLCKEAREWIPQAKKIVIGLNGHLNYGAGILLNHFDKPPVFGLPYTPDYYPAYFDQFYCRRTVSFRFSLDKFFTWRNSAIRDLDMNGITFRFMDPQNLQKDVELYTYIDNTSFTNTKYWYWSNRQPTENFELFHPFRFLIRPENLVFAEKNGKPVGFLLWYPDFNELTGPSRDLNVLDVIKYRMLQPCRTMRFTEVALLPEYRKSPAVIGMILKILPYLQKLGITECEGGFIFEENRNSMVMTSRLIERAFGVPDVQPYRTYGIFEGDLQ